MEVSGQLHALAALPWGKSSSTHWIGGWMGLRGSGRYGEEKNLLPCRERNPGRPALARRYTDWAIPVSSAKERRPVKTKGMWYYIHSEFHLNRPDCKKETRHLMGNWNTIYWVHPRNKLEQLFLETTLCACLRENRKTLLYVMKLSTGAKW
jgi:hypothetical protein